jgi:hypothetical protein
MIKSAMVLTLAVLAGEASTSGVAGPDSPVLRKMVCEVIKKELGGKDSREKGWHHGNTVVWLADPAHNITVDVTSLAILDGRAVLEGQVSALVSFEHKMKFPVGSHTCGGTARVILALKVTAVIDTQINNSQVRLGRLQIRNLHFRTEAARPFQGAVQEGVNLVLRMKKGDIERQMEAALNRVKL